jgi:tight adherence protein B
MSNQIIIVAILGLVCIAAVGFVAFAPSQRDKAKKRVQTLDVSKGARRAAGSASEAAGNRDRRRKLADALAKIEDQSKAQKKKKRVSLERRIEQAGLSITPRQFFIGSAICAILLGFLGFVTGQKLWITGALFVIGALGLPNWFVNFARGRRQKKFADEFSNAIDVIVRGVKSGLPVNECLKIIASEAPKPVCEEFHILTEGIRVGLTLEQALGRMHERMPLQEVSFFGIVLMIQQKTGGNLAEALGNLSTVLRGRKLMAGKIKALSAEAKASAMIIGALPFLVMGAVKLASPDYLTPLFTTRPGNFLLLAAATWMGMGIFVMSKMVKIKV